MKIIHNITILRENVIIFHVIGANESWDIDGITNMLAFILAGSFGIRDTIEASIDDLNK
jgi:hypothetical protein